MDAQDFLNRVFQRVPSYTISSYSFNSWNFAGRPTDEGFGLNPEPETDPEKLIKCVMNVDQYRSNIQHVEECRTITDSRFTPPQSVRFYQRVNIPVLGKVHHELVLVDAGVRQGYRVAYWYMLDSETEALGNRQGMRSGYNLGAWLAAPGVVGYALCSAPRREDVSYLVWKAMTSGANIAASSVVKDNIQAMARWARRS